MVLLLGETHEELGGSEYLALIHGRKAGRPPRVDLPQERALQRLMVEAAAQRLLSSAHDCSDGGLAVTLAECCMTDREHLIGAQVDLSPVTCRVSLRVDSLLFGESAGRIVISCDPRHAEAIEQLARRHKLPVARVGHVGGTRLTIAPWIDESVDMLSEAWRGGLLTALHGQ